MQITLTPPLEKLVQSKVESGLYQDASEVMRDALRLMAQRDTSLEWLRAEANAGFAQLDAGDYVELTREELMSELKALPVN